MRSDVPFLGFSFHANRLLNYFLDGKPAFHRLAHWGILRVSHPFNKL
jgi:hypothetical protein